MCDCFGGRSIEIEEHPTERGPPIRTYQVVRSASAKSKLPASTVVVHHPSHATRFRENAFHSIEDEDYDTARHDGRAGQRHPQPFHPLPPIIYQPVPPPQQDNDHHPFGAFEAPPLHTYPQWPDNRSVIVEGPTERAVSRLPKRLVRVHRPHRQYRSSSRRSRTRSSGGRYHYYYPDGSHGSSNTRDGDGDSWVDGVSGRGTMNSEWSDGGDSWDGGGGPNRGRQIEDGRTRRDRSRRRGYYLT